MSSKNSKLHILTNGILNENPVLRLAPHMCRMWAYIWATRSLSTRWHGFM